MDAAGVRVELIKRGIVERLPVSDVGHLFWFKDGLIHVERQSNNDLDANGCKQVLVNASSVIL